MIPIPAIPLGDGTWDWQVFTPNGHGTVAPHVWMKPPGCSLVYMFMISGGGGGGGGASGAAGSPRGGGGGGSVGGMTTCLFPAPFVPDMLHLRVGLGGAGGNAGGAGSDGTETFAFVATQQVSSNGYFASAGSTGRAGAAGTSAGGGSGGIGFGSVSFAARYILMGFMTTSGGIVASAGGAHTGAVGGSNYPDSIISPGAGGAGCQSANFDGGRVNLSNNLVLPIAPGAGSWGSPANPEGHPGLNLGLVPEPSSFGRGTSNILLSSGGGGGAALNAGVGGKGGDASWGSGGGGGGAGTTGGKGGRGGDGLIIIGTI